MRRRNERRQRDHLGGEQPEPQIRADQRRRHDGEEHHEIRPHHRGGGHRGEPEQHHRRAEDLHRAAHEACRGPDQERDDQHRLAVIAPARRQHDDDHQHQRRHDPAQVRGVGILQDQRAELGRDDRRDGERHDLAPRRLPPHADREHDAGDEVGEQETRSADLRPVERAHQRHVDQRRAETGKAAHRAGQHRNAEREGKARVGGDGRESRGGGEIDHHRSHPSHSGMLTSAAATMIA